MQRHHHGISRRSLDGPFAFGYLLTEDGVAHGERLSRGAPFLARRYDANGGQPLEAFEQCPQTRGMDSIVICYQDIRHVARGGLAELKILAWRQSFDCSSVQNGRDDWI